jgi:hypothetical protein
MQKDEDGLMNAERMDFHGLGRRGVMGRFDGGRISSDGGGVLLREVEERTHILKRLAPQVSHTSAYHQNQPVGGGKQGVAQKARDLDRA